MKKQSIRISIPSPCHEDWGKMNATEKGAFCQSCRKEVIDFSRMSERQVIEYLAGAKRVCGKFRQDQVARQMTLYKPQQGYANWKIYMIAMLPLMSFTCNPVMDTYRTNVEPPQKEWQTVGMVVMNVTPIPDTTVISGLVRDPQHHPIADAEVMLVDSVSGQSFESSQTDRAGRFQIKIIGDGRGRDLISVLRHPYEGDTIRLTDEATQYYDITLRPGMKMLMGDISIEHFK